MSVLFLHIPKTAGQSVHQYLIDRFQAENVCPARDNAGFDALDKEALSNYQVYSGHVDWATFDKLDQIDFTFSILRDPLDRILSYYFYLREQAVIFESRNDLDHRHGLKAALYDTPHQYFVDGANEHRQFLDQSFDNFYSYYFAGRSYAARNRLVPQIGSGNVFQNQNAIVDLAEMNIHKGIESVYWITDWRQGLAGDLNARNLGVHDDDADSDYQINKGNTSKTDRMDLLKDLGADDSVINRIHEMCELDYQLIDRLGVKDTGVSVESTAIRKSAA